MSAKACNQPCQSLRFDCASKCVTLPSTFACVTVDTSLNSDTTVVCSAQQQGPLLGCDVPDYACQSVCFALVQDAPTTFQFLIPFGEWQSEQEKTLAAASPLWWQAQMDTLPTGNDTVPYLSNDYLTRLDALVLPTRFKSVVIAGGYTSDVGVKGKVANVSVADDLFEQAAQITAISFANMNLGSTIPRLPQLLPQNVTTLSLFNCLFDNMPVDITLLAKLKSLYANNYTDACNSVVTDCTVLSLPTGICRTTTSRPCHPPWSCQPYNLSTYPSITSQHSKHHNSTASSHCTL